MPPAETAINLELANGIHLTDFRKTDQAALTEFLNDRDIYDRTSRIPFPYTAADAQQWLAKKLTKQNG